jgi:hypothetical protein
VIQPASEDLHGDYRFFQLAVLTRQVLLDHEAQKSRHALVAREARTCEHAKCKRIKRPFNVLILVVRP